MSDIILGKEYYDVKGACIEVHKRLGCGFLEKVYQDALEIEFNIRNIPYEREKRITIDYKGHIIDQGYIADFICYGKLIVELKATRELHDVHKAQVMNYLRATTLPIGTLVNFGETSLHDQRLVNWNSPYIDISALHNTL